MPTWFTAWAESVSLFQAAAWGAGVVAVFLFVKRGWPTVKKFATSLSRFVQMVDSVAGLPAFIDRTDAHLAEQSETLAAQDVKIESIHHEVHYNNGSSVKDAQKRTEEAVERIELGVKGFYDEMDTTRLEIVKLHDADTKMAADIENTQPRSRFEPPKET